MSTYIIRAGTDGPVKIGRAADPAARLTDLQTAHAQELHLLRVVETPFEAEPIFHERFAHRRIRGEWFEFDVEMLTFAPSAPVRVEDRPIADVIRISKEQARWEAQTLLAQIFRHFRGIETRAQFQKRMGRILQVKPRRVRCLMAGDQARIDVHEIEGLRALAKKLRREAGPQAQLDFETIE